ncbi:MAG TPA: hypothetical protein VFT13_09750 [Candidatus Krumholzibacteria bacterium]|nr:hypothetical protein [Candidatus Krumholzibacteria bacterium]
MWILQSAFLILCLLATPACHGAVYPKPLPKELRAGLEDYAREHGQHPVPYILGLFDDHDVVFLGEIHYLHHDARLPESLIKRLYNRGVRVFATEFGRCEDQTRIDSLVTAPEWDEALARAIQFDQSVEWGYQEYVDIYFHAWLLNQSLPEGAAPFRVLGLNDSPDWSQVRTREDFDDPAIMATVWSGGGEHRWAEVILQAVASGNKVLVYCGIHRAFTRYRQPVVIDGKFVRLDDTRMGNHVYRAIGDRAVTVFLHAPWPGPRGYDDERVHPAGGVIDALMLARPGGPRTVAFDLAGSPFGEIRPRDCVYMHGYEDFKLSDFCDGWMYVKPISDYEGVRPIPDWINESNLARARRQTPTLAAREYSAAEFNAMIARNADMRRVCARLR